MKRLGKLLIMYMLLWVFVPKDAFLFAASFGLHYAHHLESHGDISALDFFAEHLAGGEEHDASHEDGHHEFPCDHSHSSHCSTVSHVKILSHRLQLPVYTGDAETLAFLVHAGEPQSAASGIWQPPQSLHNLQLKG
ncbi:hypothetical protein H8S90_14010 [Olivibacter sp. SDN3]|uniref:hypothetical protein n=1 Tax=Olivibacter sp. SDN3 TaxID=2764720 RepID=UPI00165111F6|nr:hypothetical protein [Olivibacter sp. SDN3]QNL47930.1 hypothetical protein H8S90_14010 [Olivibacter sp. SDN3]